MKLLIIATILFGFSIIGFSEETVSEKAQVAGNNATRTIRKGINRTKEAFCGRLTGDNQVECLAKEAKNRLQEGADAAKDKTVEVKNYISSEKK